MSHIRVFIVSFCCCVLANAADPTGSIAGKVVDPSGAAVIGATIIVTVPATGFSRETVSASDGGYVFPLLPPASYTLTAEAAGFRRFEQRGIDVKADVIATVSVELQIGAVTDTVSVQANADLVDTQTGTLRQTVDQRSIIELPLNGRNAAALVLLAPGTADLAPGNARGRGDAFQAFTYPGAQAITSNGGRSDGVNYLLDGGSNIDPYTNVNNPFPNPDALEEFSVQTNNYSAEHGRASGAVVNIVTKFGTNQLHGDGFEFLRNGDLNARNFFAPKHDNLKRNQFGGSLGGPVLKDRLFFFATYQGTQLRNISVGNTAFVLTPAQRNGDFSSLLPRTQLVDPVTKQPFPGNVIPPDRIHSVTKKLLPLIPVSDSPDGYIVFDRPLREHENQVMGRIDYNRTHQRLYGRFSRSELPRDTISGAQNLVRSGPGFDFYYRNVSISHTYNFRPNLLNSFTFSSSATNVSRLSGAPFSLPSIGVKVAAPSPPEILIGISGFFSIATGRAGRVERQNVHFTDSAHWIQGRHEISFGGDVLHLSVPIRNTYRQSGDFRFRGSNYSGSPLADFMLGRVERFIQGGGSDYARHGNLGSLFVQDNLRASRQLNFNLGLRWDPFVPYADPKGRTPCYVPGRQSTRFPKAPVGYLLAGDAGCPDGATQSSWWQFSPRIGFAYNLGGRGKTAVRGGFGVFYQPPFAESFNTLGDSAPFSPQFFLFGVAFDDPWAGLRNPFPDQYAPNIPSRDVDFQRPVLVSSFAPQWQPTRLTSWNLTLENQLAGNVLVRVGYAASKGAHLAYNTDLNPASFGPGASGSNTQARRPNQDFQSITEDISGGNSIYNSLQLALDKRFSHGFTLGANYTFGRSIDWVSYQTDLDGINVINPFNARAYRAVSDFNVPHRFVLHYIWQLPSPKTNAVLRHLLGNWQTTGIWNWQSGFPLSIFSGEDNSFSAIGNDLADVVSKPALSAGSRGDRIRKWFTTEAFRTNAPGAFGTAGRNILSGPKTFTVDFSAQKNILFSERWRLQYRAEFFNFLNNPPLNNPGTTVTSGSFGRITSARDPRIIQMALKLYF